MRYLLILVALLLATPALAQDWAKACNTGTQFATTTVSPGQFVCYDFTTDTTSNALYVGGCENYDVFFHRDITAADNGNTTTIDVCGDRTNCDQSSWILENATLDGVAGSFEAVYGASAVWIRVDPDPIVGGTARVIVKCNIR